MPTQSQTFLNRIRNAANVIKDPSRYRKSVVSEVLDIIGNKHKDSPGRWERVRMFTLAALEKAGVSDGEMLEIGGRYNPQRDAFPNFQYTALDFKPVGKSPVPVVEGDIMNCPEIPDCSYDFVFSLDVFEHVERPWLAAKEIERILKPGGASVHSTLFSWRYHPCPKDYFRFTPDGLCSLFSELEVVDTGFDYTERRRNMIGRGKNRTQLDDLGGWRENVRVNYAGRKRS